MSRIFELEVLTIDKGGTSNSTFFFSTFSELNQSYKNGYHMLFQENLNRYARMKGQV